MTTDQSLPELHLDNTLSELHGATLEQLTVFNQWAAVALDKYHSNSRAVFEFFIDGKRSDIIINWDSNFSSDSMREGRNMAEMGGVALAMFMMSVLLGYKYVYQTEIGEGVDYGFQKVRPTSDNFLYNCHYVEVSALLEEDGSNTITNRVKIKHDQINQGSNKNKSSSVIVTLFENPLTVKELHK